MISRHNGRGYTRSQHKETVRQRPYPKTIASLAVLDSLIGEVSRSVSTFLAQRHIGRECLAHDTSLKIRALANTRPYQTDAEVRACLAFWDSLDRTYGPSGERTSGSVIALLDTWQAWINCSSILQGSLHDATFWWLEEFDQSEVGWKTPPGWEPNFFAKGRIREAAHIFIRLHQDLFPGISTISGIRTARRNYEPNEHRSKAPSPARPKNRVNSKQPLHVPGVGAYYVSSAGLHGNIADNWRFPK